MVRSYCDRSRTTGCFVSDTIPGLLAVVTDIILGLFAVLLLT